MSSPKRRRIRKRFRVIGAPFIFGSIRNAVDKVVKVIDLTASRRSNEQSLLFPEHELKTANGLSEHLKAIRKNSNVVSLYAISIAYGEGLDRSRSSYSIK